MKLPSDKDPKHNKRDYSTEIKQDMVKKMISDWSKISSVDAKVSISDQINSIKDKPSLTEIVSPPIVILPSKLKKKRKKASI